MSYLDTMYEGLFKEAAPLGNTFGNTFANQDNGAAPDKQPEPPKPMAVPAAQQQAQTPAQPAPRALTWMEQQQQRNPAPKQPPMSPAPRALTAAEQEQMNPKPPVINPYAGMPQTQEDWQRNMAENPDLWNLKGEQEVVGSDWNPDIPGELTSEQKAEIDAATNATEPAKPVAQPNQAQQQQTQPAPTVDIVLGRNSMPQSYYGERQQTQDTEEYLKRTEEANNQPPPPQKPTGPTTAADAFKLNAKGELGTTEYLRNAETGEYSPVFRPLDDKEIEAFGKRLGYDEAFMESEMFQKQMTDEQRMAYLTGVITKDASDWFADNWNLISGTDFALSIGAEGFGDALSWMKHIGIDTTNNATEGMKNRMLSRYLDSPEGESRMREIISKSPYSTVKTVCDQMLGSGQAPAISEKAQGYLTEAVKSKCWEGLSENFFGNLPGVISLWFKSMGWNTMGELANNPWMFYSGLLALLAGGGALIGGGLGLFGNGGGGSTVIVQQSPQDSYRQSLYRTF